MRGSRGDCITGVGDGGCVVAMSARHEYVGGTCGSCVVSSAGDMLGMSVVRRMRGVCELCMCLARAVWEVNG